ncbi:recombination protein NinB [Comamonas serinivorans]|nr:recombination protein NinB [Comamonas serinivorans]
METIDARLVNPAQAHQVIQEAWQLTKAMLIAGHRMKLVLKAETRSDAQNRLLHAMLSEISKQVEWAGAKRDTDTWKRLLTAAWLRTRGEQVELLPAIDGHGIDVVFRRTSQLTRAECAELSEFVMAWAADHGVVPQAGKQWEDYQ